ncbi:unnamed protein product [Polarella glacialis]|uniref:ISXO2-like transposase domain-containing protein n=1 Tax=Polarella glacialis TaxID=89957 RepID=A0A813DJA8_POLGL|nr:unnamed protein product [Polarella glacialis]
MTSKSQLQKIWPSPIRAFLFLAWTGIMCLPLLCPAGHGWKSSAPLSGKSCLHCLIRIPSPRKPDEDDDQDYMTPCNKKVTWRWPDSFQYTLPVTMTILQLLKGLYWFAQLVPIRVCVRESGMTVKVFRELSFKIRSRMFAAVQRNQAAAPMLGGPGKAVCLDETYFTKKKHAKGWFLGHFTVGHETIVLGMIEIDLLTRKAGGNVRLLIIPSTSKAVMAEHIKADVQPGSPIITDSLRSYAFLSRPLPGFVHRAINHRRREFSRLETIFEQKNDVSTNSVEGLFGRVKTFVRQRNLNESAKAIMALS